MVKNKFVRTRVLQSSGFVLLAIVFYFCASFLPMLLQNGLYFVSDRLELPYDYFDRNLNMAYTLVSVILAGLYGVLYFFRFRPQGAADTLLSLPQKIAIIVAGAFGISGISMVWLLFADEVLSGIPFVKEALTAFNQNEEALLEGTFLWLFVAACIVGPVVEELVFRGLIYNALARAFRSPVPAITISGLAFGIWHGNLIQSVYTAIMGMILAFVYYKTKNLVFQSCCIC